MDVFAGVSSVSRKQIEKTAYSSWTIMDSEIRNLEKEYAASGDLNTFVRLQKKKCRIGDHCWSHWIFTHNPGLGPGSGTGVRGCWVMWGKLDHKNTSYEYRECLCCTAKQRRITRLGGRSEENFGPIIIVGREKLESIIIDL